MKKKGSDTNTEKMLSSSAVQILRNGIKMRLMSDGKLDQGSTSVVVAETTARSENEGKCLNNVVTDSIETNYLQQLLLMRWARVKYTFENSSRWKHFVVKIDLHNCFICTFLCLLRRCMRMQTHCRTKM